MTKISRTIEIDAPVEQVFGYFSDPEHLPEIWPSMLEVSNVERGEGGGFDWVYKMAGIRFRGHSQNLEWKQNERIVNRSAEGIPSTFTYTFEGRDGGTSFTTEVEYEIPHKVLGKLAEPVVRRLNEHEADAFVHNLKARVELEEERGEERGLGAAEAGRESPPP